MSTNVNTGDHTEVTKSATKLYLESLQRRYDKEDCDIDDAIKGSYQIMLAAGHNAVNGGHGNDGSIQVAVGALICAIAEDKLSQNVRMLRAIETNRAQSCPFTGKVTKDKQGNPQIEGISSCNTLLFTSKWFSISSGGKFGTVVGAIVLITVLLIGYDYWRMRRFNASIDKSTTLVERTVEREADRTIEQTVEQIGPN